MRELILFRHAKSDWSTGLVDHERPLNARGERDAPAAGEWLKQHTQPVELVIVSSAVRTQQTLELALKRWDIAPEIRTEPAIYEAPARRILDVIATLDDSCERAMIVGHNPGMSDTLALLTGSHEHEFKTSSIAVLTMSGSWTSLTGEVSAFVTPRG